MTMETTIIYVDDVIAVTSIFLGMIACFYGYKLFRFFLGVLGFMIFLSIGFVIVYYFISPNIIAASVVGSCLALFGAVFVSYFPSFGAFSFGTFFGGMIAVLFISVIRVDYMQQDSVRDITIFSCGIIGGLLAYYHKRVAILFGTSVIGAYASISGLDNFILSGFNDIIYFLINFQMSNMQITVQMIVLVITFILLATLGIIVQYKSTKHIMHTPDDVIYTSLPSFHHHHHQVSCLPFGRKTNEYTTTSIDEVPLLDVSVVE
eukprot:TRINITY_DN1544_c0_g1_i2.p1 TRINITY_DN1544_c0_g1~~TRINITY_DN1544_c0_g1_i2.p1  ORF type:complete len:262 (+),score=48.16 TRINITY_DN1544_c0_g1_i2:136-921(+)